MKTIDDGGHAFPSRHVTEGQFGLAGEGMSLRDWFAGMALQGLATNQEMLMANKELIDQFGTTGIDRLQADKAYRLADAMIARSK